ncbi:GYD domain-containing protein [Paraburkholderia dinghuensis]|uniref:GYD domain-containing protein n=1 Tax=Paraburkholderia dinghuensis TaxID=2305225 RepID=A0A3N6MP23_9BURK|nr:GYD domain-containing protein [Paraburkholderia dinghuensis]RQH05338.1 GYD domain-containing protein [Paraburkholderia dinghuensis]
MGTYVVLAQFTDQGIRTVKNSPQRAAQTAEMGKAFGCEVKDIYWTLGQYDLTIILEAKDDESLTAFGLALGSAGNVRTQTMRAFNKTEFSALISKLP